MIFLLILAGALLCHGQDLPASLQQPGYQHFYNLEFEEAKKDFEALAAQKPDSPDAYNLIAQAVIFRTMYRAGALESGIISDKNPFFERPRAEMTPADEKQFLYSLDKSAEICKTRLARNANDVGALYALGVGFALRADYNFIVKKAWIATLRASTQSRKYHAQVSQLNPNNYDARLTQGLHAYISGNLVFPWKQLGLLAGFRGDKETGIRILTEVLNHGENTRAEAAMFLDAIYRRDHRPAEGIPLVEMLIRWFPRNYIFRLELVYLYLDLRQKDKATELVAQIEQLKQSGAPGFDKMPAKKLDELHAAIRALPAK